MTTRVSTGNTFSREYTEYLIGMYKEADLVVLAHVVSIQEDIPAHGDSSADLRKTCEVLIRKILKGSYQGSEIVVECPWLIGVSDSSIGDIRGVSRLNMPWVSAFGLPWAGEIFEPGRHLILLRHANGKYTSLYASRPDQRLIELYLGGTHLPISQEPDTRSLDIQALISDPEARARAERICEQAVLWYRSTRLGSLLHYEFQFENTPVAGRAVPLRISAGPGHLPYGLSVAWVVPPVGFEVLDGVLVGATDVGVVDKEEIAAKLSTNGEYQRAFLELTNRATVRFNLTVRAAEGTHAFKIYAIGRDPDGRIQAGFQDYWVRVYEDTAETSGDERFLTYPSYTGEDSLKPNKPSSILKSEEETGDSARIPPPDSLLQHVKWLRVPDDYVDLPQSLFTVSRDTLWPKEPPSPLWILPELTQAHNGRDTDAIDSLLTADFEFVPAQGEANKEGTEEHWDRPEFIAFNETLFDPEFRSDSGFYGAESIYAEFVLISKRPIDVPDSNHWELTCEVRWLIFNSRREPKPFAATYKSVACLTVKPDPLNEGSWLIRKWLEESAEVRQLYR